MDYDWEALRRENVLLKAQLQVLEHRLEDQRTRGTAENPLPEGLFLQEIIGLYARLPERFTVEDLIQALRGKQPRRSSGLPVSRSADGAWADRRGVCQDAFHRALESGYFLSAHPARSTPAGAIRQDLLAGKAGRSAKQKQVLRGRLSNPQGSDVQAIRLASVFFTHCAPRTTP